MTGTYGSIVETINPGRIDYVTFAAVPGEIPHIDNILVDYGSILTDCYLKVEGFDINSQTNGLVRVKFGRNFKVVNCAIHADKSQKGPWICDNDSCTGGVQYDGGVIGDCESILIKDCHVHTVLILNYIHPYLY